MRRSLLALLLLWPSLVWAQNPMCPTRPFGTNDNSCASTAFVQAGLAGVVQSVSNSDSTLTISPTTGNVVASLNLAHANTWTAPQNITINQNAATQLVISNNSAGAAALVGTALSNGTGSGSIRLGGTGYTGESSIFQNRVGIEAGTLSSGIALNNSGANPIVLGISDTEVARFGSNPVLQITPAANSAAKGFALTQSGVAVPTAGPIDYSTISNTVVTGNVTGSGGIPYSVRQATLYVATTATGTGAGLDQVQGGLFFLNDTSSSTTDKVALAGYCYKGSGNNTNGACDGVNAVSVTAAGATTIENNALEAEVAVSNTATVTDRIAVKANATVLSAGTWTGTGSRTDAAFGVVTQSGGAPFVNLIKLTRFNLGADTSTFPLASTGKLFSSDIAGTIDTAFDFSNITISTNILTASNSIWTGAGRMTVGSNTAPSSPVVIRATATSSGQVDIYAGTEASTSGFNGLDILSVAAANEIVVGAYGGGNTATTFGLTNANYTVVKSAGASSLGLLIGTVTADPLVFGTTDIERVRIPATGGLTITSALSTAFAVGRLGTTTPAFLVDASTATSITGVQVKSAASGGGVALSAIGETNVNLTIDANGSGTITLGGTSTGAITLTRATTLSAALTYGGVTLSNAVTGTGNMVLSSSPTLTTPAITTSATLSNNGIGTSPTDGYIAQNTTAAGAGAQQYSPAVHFIAQGWKTAATAGSQTLDARIDIRPVQGVNNPTPLLAFSLQSNSLGYVTVASVQLNEGAGNAALNFNSPASKNTNLVYQANAVNKWYVQNQGDTADAYRILNSDANGNAAQLVLGQVGTATFAGYVQTGVVAVGSLPACGAGTKGARHFVNDSNAVSYTAGIGAVVAAGGTTNVPVVCDGTNWRIGANDNIPERLRRKYA